MFTGNYSIVSHTFSWCIVLYFIYIFFYFVILILGNSRRQRDGELLNLYQNCLDVSHDRRWLCIMMNSALLFVSVINMVRAMVFKLGSTDQRGSAAGSQGVHERIPKMLIVFTTFYNLRLIFSDIFLILSCSVTPQCFTKLSFLSCVNRPN